jgi:uncharacterized protein (TIGR02246 family)
MDWQAHLARDTQSADEAKVRALYHALMDAWNGRDARGYAALFMPEATVVGFDGSVMNSRALIEATLNEIFGHHQTPPYVSKIRSVRFPVPDTGVLSAVAGMIPPGQQDLNPALNAIQTLVAARQGNDWRIAVFQNTPAAFHGRPQLAEKLTEELREVARGSARQAASGRAE